MHTANAQHSDGAQPPTQSRNEPDAMTSVATPTYNGFASRSQSGTVAGPESVGGVLESFVVDESFPESFDPESSAGSEPASCAGIFVLLSAGFVSLPSVVGLPALSSGDVAMPA